MVGILLYIDPGTGAMLFTTILGLITTASFALRKLFIKLKFRLTAGKGEGDSVSEKLPIVIFSDSKRYWNVFKPVCDELEKRGQECYYWTSSHDDPALDEDYKIVKCSFIGEGNRAFVKLNSMNAYICLSTTPGLDVYQWRRSKLTDYYVHTSHEVGGFTLYRMFGLDFYDAVLLTGSFQEDELRKLEELRNIKRKEMVVVGAPYLDTAHERRLALESSDVENKTKKTVLVAPSWGEEAILSKYGSKLLLKLKDSPYEVIIRPHPQSKQSETELLDRLTKEFPESEDWHWNYDNDNFEVLNKSDILISDFSGVIFDFALVFDKPVIYTSSKMDVSIYDAWWIKEPSWREAILSVIGRQLSDEDIPNIVNVINDALASETLQEGRDKARNEAWMNRGHAAEATADYLIGKLNELRKEEKINA